MSRPVALRGLLFVLAVAISVPLAGTPAHAGHDMARDCYDCHSLKGGEVYDNSYAISTTSAVGPDPAVPFRCDFCHSGHANYFDNTYLTGIYQSSHPVQLIEGNQLISKFFNSGTATTIECKACHGGNTVTGSPTDRDPDVAPSAYTVSGDTPTDGYPDHDTENAPDNVVIQGDEPHLTAAYDPTPASTAEVATNYALCFTCHDGGASTTRAKNIQQDYIDKGHFFKSDVPSEGITAEDRIPCSDCHSSHASRNARLFAPDNATVKKDSGGTPLNELRALCIACHNDGAVGNYSDPDGSGWPRVRTVTPTLAPDSVSDHITFAGAQTNNPCTDCHGAHKTPAGGNNCLDCHRTGGPVKVKHQQADLEFPADGVGGENNLSVQESGHTGVIYSAVDNYATKATNECKKCHGTSHPSEAAKLLEADRANSYATGFVYGLSLSGSTWSANPASFADGDGNGIIDGNDFCMSCHDGADALDAGGKSNIRIGGVDCGSPTAAGTRPGTIARAVRTISCRATHPPSSCARHATSTTPRTGRNCSPGRLVLTVPEMRTPTRCRRGRGSPPLGRHRSRPPPPSLPMGERSGSGIGTRT
jgi:nitrate reductase cytochrome c-type subunit